MFWPRDLGLLLWNGANGLVYYSGQAARVFVANAGMVATIAVGGYFFPNQTAAGVVGAVAIRGATWLTKKVDENHHVHLADAVGKLLDVSPNPIVMGFYHTTRIVGFPQRTVSTAIDNVPTLSWVNESLATELVSPLLEEAIFRVGLQEGLALGLTVVGVPQQAAILLSGVIAATLFAGAHDPEPNSRQYRDTLISGIGFGLMMHLHGLPAAVVAHAANNVGVRLQNALQ